MNTAKAIGEPGDFNDRSDDIEVPFRAGSSPYIRLANSAGEDETVTLQGGAKPKEGPIGTANANATIAGPKVVFADTNDGSLLKYTTVGGYVATITDDTGSTITVGDPAVGIVVGQEPS